MNYLAHIYLSGNDEDNLIGNFIGDAIKGNDYLEYPLSIQRGIVLHRFIDSFTDTHDVTQRMRKRLQPYFRKYAGVVCDVYYDHFLANSWSTYHHLPLSEFIENAYTFLSNNPKYYPKEIQIMLPYMIENDWLGNMLHTEGVAKSLNGLSKRTPYPSGMDKSAPVLLEHYAALNEDFDSFFPDLKEAVQQKIDEMSKLTKL